MSRRELRNLTLTVTFIEFDSSNLSHAGAHYSVTVAGPDATLDKARRGTNKVRGTND